MPEAVASLVRTATGRAVSARTDHEGRFTFSLLSPGVYKLVVNATPGLIGGATVEVKVAENVRIELRLQVRAAVTTEVSAENWLQLDTSALGHVMSEHMVSNLPLVTRNFTQIVGLSPGVTTGVFNAGELGLGGTALSQTGASTDGLYVHGARSYENNWQLDGISTSDVQGSGSSSGGIPIPNPDTIQEFKAQTALFDAGFGRYGGANISVITKSGTNAYHGTIFEFLRNDFLNANDFFLKRTNQRQPELKQNQFGFAVGGPVRKDKVLFFGSYQGTRQINGFAAGQPRIACTAALSSPPLTDDRSPAALGHIFGGMSGVQGGTVIKPDGSNINPISLDLLNFRLSDGNFLISTPQSVDLSKPFATQGFSSFSSPCSFSQDQFATNADMQVSQKSKVEMRSFVANDSQIVSFPGNFFNPTANTRGFANPSGTGYRVFSLSHTYSASDRALNQARIGYVRTSSKVVSAAPFKWSDIGVAEGEMNNNNGAPNLAILGSVRMASAFPRHFVQESFVAADDFSFARGAHFLRAGASLTRLHDNFGAVGDGSFVEFLSWPDFLLGLSSTGNGTGTFSNVFASIDDFGLFDRAYRVWEASSFIQDSYRLRKSFTLDLGLRYERLGQFADSLGRNSSFDFAKADPNPPQSGSVAGYLVASNFSGTPPAGVGRTKNEFGNYGVGQNTIAPRLGFAWKFLPQSKTWVLHSGYGAYYSRTTGQAFFQSANGAPYTILRFNIGSTNQGATFQTPFTQPFPTPASFPVFPPHSDGTNTTVYTVAPSFRPALVHQFALNVQGELDHGWVMEAGYVGTRGLRLQRVRSLNQALPASLDQPIRGARDNTVANIPSRVRLPGIPADSLDEVESEGSSWYNGLEASMSKEAGHGFKFLAGYTLSKVLDTDGADINGTSAGIALTLGNQNSPPQRWGRASFNRTHRFVLSAIWSSPRPARGIERALLGGWSISAIAVIQSGSALTIANTNPTNVFGISEDRAQLSGKCSKGQLVTDGSMESKLKMYFNRDCFVAPLIIGADGVGTAFGNSRTGIVDGPHQANLDIAISRIQALNWPKEKSTIQFRTEFFNALNHPQFGNPDSNFASPTFGLISSTVVSPRVGQLAVKLAF